ncbi:MAG: tetratricopeptide repeat protein [Candidatus Omnitrophota bacterium]
MPRYAKFIAIIFVLSVAVYVNSLGGSFISDDLRSIVKNPKINDILLSDGLTVISNKLLYKIAKLNPAPYHLFSIFLHAVNSVLVFCLLLYFFSVWPSFWGALVFSVHPIHTEAVSWISANPYLLFTLFTLASFLLYLGATSKYKFKIGSYISSLLLLIISLITSWYAFLYPGMIILYDFVYKRWKKNWRLWLPFIISAVAYLIIQRYAISEAIAIRSQMRIGSAHIANPLIRVAFCLFGNAKLLIWPLKLAFYRDWTIISSESLISVLGFLVLVLCLLPYWFKKAKPAFFALSIFILFLSPSYISTFTGSLFAERYLYLPSVSFCILIAYIFQRYAHVKKSKNIVTMLLIIMIGGFSVRTVLRNNDWKNPMRFGWATVEASPLCPAGYLNLGNAYFAIKRYKLAKDLYNMAIKIDPRYTPAYNDFAAAYINLGEYKQAIAICKKALEIKKDDSAHGYLYGNLGRAYMGTSEYEHAITAFKKAIEVRPDYESHLDVLLYNKLGEAYVKKGDHEQAIAAFEKVIKLKPDDAEAHGKLAETYYYAKQYDLAIRHYDRALELGHGVDVEFSMLLEPYR